MNRRAKAIATRVIEETELDLSGLIVVVEAASHAYRFNPVIAAAAGAEVVAITRDSQFALASEVKQQVGSFAKLMGVQDSIEIVDSLSDAELGTADIIANTGFVRPIDESKIKLFKPTAVVSLMWETWEYRGNEVDLNACKKHGILCLGTNESAPPLSMDPYAGMLALKQLFDLGLEGYDNRVVLVGANKYPERIASFFDQVGIRCFWFTPQSDSNIRNSNNLSSHPLEQLPEWWEENGHQIDAMLIAELSSDLCMLGDNGLLPASRIAVINPEIRIGVLAGVVDLDGLRGRNLHVMPNALAPPGYMSVQLYDMGPAPIMRLFAGGLKVGELMARARRSGLGVHEAASQVLENPLAMDFEGDLSWL